MPPPGKRTKNKRPSRPKRSRPNRPNRGAGGRRSKLKRQQRVNKRVAERRQQADSNRGIAAARASGQRKKSQPQYLTGRDAAARTASKGTNQSSLQQSVGSLDRRINTALQKGDTDKVKDLRSRQKKFVKKLGYKRAEKSGGVLRTSDGKIMRTSDGSPMLTGPGLDVFQETMDMDFLDPTRQIQNEYPEAYSEMYPVASQLQAGLPGVRLAKEFFGMNKKKIPYSSNMMPGEAYPLDPVAVRTRSNRQAPLDGLDMTLSDRQPQFGDEGEVPLPLISVEFGEDDSVGAVPDGLPFTPNKFPGKIPNERAVPPGLPFTPNRLLPTNEVAVPSDFPFDPNTGSASIPTKFYSDQIAVPEGLPFGANTATTLSDLVAADSMPDGTSKSIQDERTSMALQGAGYNLDPNIISQLYDQGLLQSGTNYFPNPRISSSPLVDEALASYYQTLK